MSLCHLLTWCPDLFVMGVCETISVGLDSHFTGLGACFSDLAAIGLAGKSLCCSRIGGKLGLGVMGQSFATETICLPVSKPILVFQ